MVGARKEGFAGRKQGFPRNAKLAAPDLAEDRIQNTQGN